MLDMKVTEFEPKHKKSTEDPRGILERSLIPLRVVPLCILILGEITGFVYYAESICYCTRPLGCARRRGRGVLPHERARRDGWVQRFLPGTFA